MFVSPRLHLFEVNDQEWWPQFLREKVQDVLTLLWTSPQPIVTPVSPASVVCKTLTQVLGSHVSDYVYVDFASGAGGPTPYIEQKLNRALRDQGKREVPFVLSDLKPHLSAWSAAAKKSENLSYFKEGIDAANAPMAETLLRDVPGAQGKKIMRLFSLAFHHFDDDLAGRILKNTAETSDGFCIFELQSREPSSFLIVSLLWPVTLMMTAHRLYHSLVSLIFTYLIPLIPMVVVFDGYISSLRTRTPREVEDLLVKNVGEDRLRRENWKFLSGSVRHTWPCGYLHWVVCVKDGTRWETDP